MSRGRYPRMASFKTAAALRAHLQQSDIPLDFDDDLAPAAESPLARPADVSGFQVGNRFCILPMEGWDGSREGEPTDLNRRRWRRFGSSGAKLIWGGEAVAVRQDGRASPNQLLMTPRTQPAIAALREDLVAAHRDRFGQKSDGDLLVGLQLTHSGRFAKPNASDRPEPVTAAIHPLLDRRFPAGVRLLSDDEIDRLVDDFVAAARLAWDAGFPFVDIKHCHGYFAHELLGARTRPGRYGGPLDHRLRFLRRVVSGIRAAVPSMAIGVRLSAFDTVPFRKTASGIGEPDPAAPPLDDFGFSVVEHEDLDGALTETRALLQALVDLGIQAVCLTGGTPYYNPHVQRPALFPPVDGYEPPEDPLRGVARQIQVTARLKAAFPHLRIVGSAYSYLQEWLPHVAQYTVRQGLTDFVGLGRLVLAYPDLPADVLAGAPMRRALLCRTFSDCTTGPRMGFVSGCYPLDPFYADKPEAKRVLEVRTRQGHG
jgi:2,4-dienoyl-CoA reductase-like NADH-dependent reductase (Old Yellow Enzyme family)